MAVSKQRKHTMVVTASFNRGLDLKRARYFLQMALGKIRELGADHSMYPPRPTSLVRAEVKNVNNVLASKHGKIKGFVALFEDGTIDWETLRPTLPDTRGERMGPGSPIHRVTVSLNPKAEKE